MDATIALTDLRVELPTIIKKIAGGFDRLVVTVFGKPKAVLMNIEELESLEETLDILSEPGALKDIREGLKEAKAGKGVPLRDLL
jgi:prevent-host-death family protein